MGLLAGLTGCGGSESADTAQAESYVDSPAAAPGSATPGPSATSARPSDGDAADGESGSAGALTEDSAVGIGADPVAPGAPSPPSLPPGPGTGQVEAGTLTAGTWDDNLNLERFLDYREELRAAGMSGLLDFDAQAHEAARPRGTPSAHTKLDISLVIDTTGSMGDELQYLQTEFLALSTTIQEKYPSAEQRWSLVVYRDVGDAYVARGFDFGADPDVFRQQLGEQSPGGGGDFPEAPDAAFERMNQLAWRSDPNTAKLAFWVADAPHHDDRAAALKAAIETSQAQGVHIYPVASSGVDELTELTMRSAAQLTGGRYLFLTDDSGVGGAHKEPSIPCYFVTQLDAAILRMVDIEMTGVYREPTAGELVRAGGDPQDGACKLESGQSVFVF
ncbi:MAG: hypothetical protein RL033_6290 [Pseudomonadota bacterium]